MNSGTEKDPAVGRVPKLSIGLLTVGIAFWAITYNWMAGDRGPMGFAYEWAFLVSVVVLIASIGLHMAGRSLMSRTCLGVGIIFLGVAAILWYPQMVGAF